MIGDGAVLHSVVRRASRTGDILSRGLKRVKEPAVVAWKTLPRKVPVAGEKQVWLEWSRPVWLRWNIA